MPAAPPVPRLHHRWPCLWGPAAAVPCRHARRAARRTVATGRAADPSADVLVVGAGAAGLTAAHFAAKAGARTVLLERTKEAGKKILMSGGARCNVMPAVPCDSETDFFVAAGDALTPAQRRYAKKVARLTLESWDPDEVRAWFKRDIGLRLSLEDETNKLFPTSNSSREVRDKLVDAVEGAGVTIRYGSGISAFKRLPCDATGELVWHAYAEDPPTKWSEHAPGALIATARTIVVATGGLSFPAVGTDGTGHDAVRALGVRVAPTYPALVPLLGAPPGAAAVGSLAGVSLADVRLRAEEREEKAPAADDQPTPKKRKKNKAKKTETTAHRGGFLFSHRGFTGPALLDLSHRIVLARDDAVAERRNSVRLLIDWTGAGREVWLEHLEAARASGVGMRGALRGGGIPQRLADALLAHADIPTDRAACELRREERDRLLEALVAHELDVGGADGGFKKAEVSGGGVPLSSLNASTLEVSDVPGVSDLFLCGEVVDVHGRIGGFNFLWAWTSARRAGLSAAARAAATAAPGAAVGL